LAHKYSLSIEAPTDKDAESGKKPSILSTILSDWRYSGPAAMLVGIPLISNEVSHIMGCYQADVLILLSFSGYYALGGDTAFGSVHVVRGHYLHPNRWNDRLMVG